MKSKNGFTLVELLIYTGIIAVVGSLFGGVLVNVTRVQNRQTASSEVNQQLNFALQNIQRLVRDSSTIDVSAGISTTTLRLYMKEGSRDLTQIYVQNNKIFIKERSMDPNPLIIPLTNDAVRIDSLNFLKIASTQGHDSVQIDLAITANSSNPQQSFTQTLTSAVARVSAATFDADLIPGANNNYNIGVAANRWKNLYLSGDLTIGGKTTIGNLASDPAGVNGMIYYNITSNLFRGYKNGAWGDLSGGPWTTTGNDIYNTNSGNVGIGKNNPGYLLDVNGTAQLTGLRMPTGAVNGKVLTSDASGNATWQSSSGFPSGYSILGDTSTAPSGYTYTGSTVSAQQGEQWAAKANMLTARHGSVAGTVNNKIYVIGGFGGAYLATNEEYDPVTNTWTTKTSMPTARSISIAEVINNKIYVIGGYSGPTTGVTTNEEYDPVANTWVAKTAMPTARYGSAASTVNNKIYVIGGFNGSNLATNEEYDPVANTWVAKTAMPTARFGAAAGTVNSKIYVIGGCVCGSGTYIATNEEYDPAANTWVTKASMSTTRRAAIAEVINNKIYVIGGYNGSYLTANEEYDPNANAWTNKASMTTSRYGPAASIVSGKIYVIGGFNGSTLAVNEEYTLPSIVYYYVHKKD